MRSYNHKEIENKWQNKWQKEKLYEVTEESDKEKFYLLVEFPYPSGDGLHVGHVRSYTALDIVARKKRAEGNNVLYPIGWDAFGLPTENYALKTGVHPAKVTKQNTDNFRRQLQSIGFSFDWSREINTTDPKYYRWTQWIFLKFFEKGLAYKARMPINWCIDCKIGLANEEAVDEVCERCGGSVEFREKEQWMLKITEYADRLDKDLDTVDYWDRIKIQQRNWIGRNEGAEITFPLKDQSLGITIFTTRPDTLFGATFMVLAPEHGILKQLKKCIGNWDDVAHYIEAAGKKTETERIEEGGKKTGIKLEGITAINPANKEEIPVYVADYVLGHYGTGAIMAVPAHDERDFAFAQAFNLPIRQVIEPVYSQSTDPGKVKDGVPFDDREAIIAIVKHWSEEKYIGLKWKKVAWGTFITGGIEEGQTPEEAAKMEIREETGYLHPKLVADFGKAHGKFYHVPKKTNRFAHTQILYFKLENNKQEQVSQEEAEKHEVMWLTKEELKTFLTPDSHHRALELLEGKAVYTGEGVLTNSDQFNEMNSGDVKNKITDFVGGEKKTTYKLRDWVFSRQRYWGEPIPLVFCEKCGWTAVPEDELPVELPDVAKYQPTDTGESPLAAITDWVNTTCPKCKGGAKRETDTMPNWAGSSWYYLRYCDPKNDIALAEKEKLQYWIPVDWYNGGMEHTTLHLLYSRFWHKFLFDIKVVSTKEPYAKRTSHGLILAEGGEKMSKSKGNIVNPDDVVEKLGADTLRVYEMFMGPFDQPIAWSADNMVGSRRFLERVWKAVEMVTPEANIDADTERLMHQTIKKVGFDIEELKFNTAISQLMILLNRFETVKEISKDTFITFIRLLAPFAPHISEELWEQLGHTTSVHTEAWPPYDEAKAMPRAYTIAVQVNGVLRGTFMAEGELDERSAKMKALEMPAVAKYVGERAVQKTFYVKNRLINIVI